MHAADGQKLADVAHEPSRAAKRHQRCAHVAESQITPEPQPVLDRLLGRPMPIGRQVRRDQRPRARADDHPHLILKLGQQHRQHPRCVSATRPAAAEHQTHLAARTILPAHGLTRSRSPARSRGGLPGASATSPPGPGAAARAAAGFAPNVEESGFRHPGERTRTPRSHAPSRSTPTSDESASPTTRCGMRAIRVPSTRKLHGPWKASLGRHGPQQRRHRVTAHSFRS